MQTDCIFCKIVRKEIPADFEEETEDLVVFKDINPKAQIHFLIVAKTHVADIRNDNGVLWASIGKMATKLAKKLNISGFRLVHNAGEAAEVKHMHVHFLGEVGLDREL